MPFPPGLCAVGPPPGGGERGFLAKAAASPAEVGQAGGGVSFHADEQAEEDGSPFLLGDPLDLGTAEAGVHGLGGRLRGRADLVGARAHAHLQGHLGGVLSVRLGVFESGKREGKKIKTWLGLLTRRDRRAETWRRTAGWSRGGRYVIFPSLPPFMYLFFKKIFFSLSFAFLFFSFKFKGHFHHCAYKEYKIDIKNNNNNF